MILGHFELTEPIELREGEISTVVIENPMLYRRFVCAMLDQSVGESDEFRLSDENGELEFGKNVCVITDVFNISFNTRAVSVKLLHELGENTHQLSCDTEKLITELNMFAAELSSTAPVDVAFTELSSTDALLKLFNFAVDVENYDFVEKITEYISLSERLFGKRLFILLNLKSALTTEEQSEFFKLMSYKKINVLLIENKVSERCAENEKIRIIDSDLCAIG